MLLRHRIISVELSIKSMVASLCTTMVQDIWIYICRGKTRNECFVRARLSGTASHQRGLDGLPSTYDPMGMLRQRRN